MHSSQWVAQEGCIFILNYYEKTYWNRNKVQHRGWGVCKGSRETHRAKSYKLSFSKQDEWELVPNKFDITTLKPFDKVLVRGDVEQRWIIDFFGFMDNKKGYPFVCVGHYVIQCIPYEGNEYLLNTTNNCY